MYGDTFLYDDMQFEEAVGELMTQRVHTSGLQQMLRCVNICLSVSAMQPTHVDLQAFMGMQMHIYSFAV